MSELSYSCTPANMECNRPGNNIPSRTDSVVQQTAQQRVQLNRLISSGLIRHTPWRPWTAEEDEILRVLPLKWNIWKNIAERFKDRTHFECVNRWRQLRASDVVGVPLKKEEDRSIIQLVKRFGVTQWSAIAEYLPGRTAEQCQERWDNHLNPYINKEDWTKDEAWSFIRTLEDQKENRGMLGMLRPGIDNRVEDRWFGYGKRKLDILVASELAPQLQHLSIVSHPSHSAAFASKKQHRVGDHDKVEFSMDLGGHGFGNRWKKLHSIDLTRVPFSKEEDKRIIQLVKRFGAKQWDTIAVYLRGRTAEQCKERWDNHLNKEDWTEDEAFSEPSAT